MGSLPNLDHVHQEQLERREREKERTLARERAREREFCHDLDSWRERVRYSICSQNQVELIFAAFHVVLPLMYLYQLLDSFHSLNKLYLFKSKVLIVILKPQTNLTLLNKIPK